MIKLRDNSILVLGCDGRSAPFEPEELQTRIIKACLAAGSQDVWIAQDISLSVEFAIISRSGSSSAVVRSAELDSLVTKILDDTGYPEVAEMFRLSAPKPDGVLDYASEPSVKETVAKRLGLEGEALSQVAKKVASSLAAMGFSKCSPQLVVELARHHKDALEGAAGAPLSAPRSISAPQGASSFIAGSASLCELLKGEARALAACGAVSPRPVSKLFPSLGVDVRLEPFALRTGLSKPATELALMPKIQLLANAVDELCAAADSLCAKAGRSDCLPLPLWLNFADVSRFSSEWLDCGLEASSGPSFEMASQIAASLSRAPFKTTFL